MSTTLNLAMYRLNELSEFDKYLQVSGNIKFWEFMNKAYSLLTKMLPGEELIIERDVRPENHELFIKASCLFIWDGNWDYEFSDDYAVLKRQKEIPKINIQKKKEIRK